MEEHETIEWKMAGDWARRGMVNEIILDSGPISSACAGGLKTKNKSVSEHGGMSSTDHGIKPGVQDMMLLDVLFERALSLCSEFEEVRCINDGD